MSPQVKAALLTQAGALLYLACWVVAMQWVFCYFSDTPEKAWVVRLWKWWGERADRTWERTAAVFQLEPRLEEP